MFDDSISASNKRDVFIMNHIAVIGYNNALAKNLLELMSLRGYDQDCLGVFAPNPHKDTQIPYGDDEIKVRPLSELQSSDFDAAIFVSDTPVVQKQILSMKSSGIKIINATSALNGLDDILTDILKIFFVTDIF